MLIQSLPRLFLVAALVLGAPLAPALATDAEATVVATPFSAEQVRAQWAAARKAYLDSIAPYAADPRYVVLIKDYTLALDDTGKSLEAYIKLKLTTPPVAPVVMTPAVDLLVKNLTRLKTLQAQAQGNLITVLGGALKQQQQITQNAIKNMR
jgi:hypothetical protein